MTAQVQAGEQLPPGFLTILHIEQGTLDAAGTVAEKREPNELESNTVPDV